MASQGQEQGGELRELRELRGPGGLKGLKGLMAFDLPGDLAEVMDQFLADNPQFFRDRRASGELPAERSIR